MTLWIEDAKMENFDEKYDVGERSLVMIKAASMVIAALSGLLLLALRGPMPASPRASRTIGCRAVEHGAGGVLCIQECSRGRGLKAKAVPSRVYAFKSSHVQ